MINNIAFGSCFGRTLSKAFIAHYQHQSDSTERVLKAAADSYVEARENGLAGEDEDDLKVQSYVGGLSPYSNFNPKTINVLKKVARFEE